MRWMSWFGDKKKPIRFWFSSGSRSGLSVGNERETVQLGGGTCSAVPFSFVMVSFTSELWIVLLLWLQSRLSAVMSLYSFSKFSCHFEVLVLWPLWVQTQATVMWLMNTSFYHDHRFILICLSRSISIHRGLFSLFTLDGVDSVCKNPSHIAESQVSVSSSLSIVMGSVNQGLGYWCFFGNMSMYYSVNIVVPLFIPLFWL